MHLQKNTDLHPSSHAESDALFRQISQQLQIQPQKRSKWRPGFVITAVRYFSPRIAMLLFVIITFTFSLLFLTSPLEAQNIAVSQSSAGSERVSFEVENSFWVKSVSASLNHAALPVTQTDAGYYVDVSANGVLLLEIETVSHVCSQTEIVIDTIDDQAPHIQRHSQNNDEIFIYLSDGDGEGIDWDAISGRSSLSDTAVSPVRYDAAAGYVVFKYPTEPIYISIPDHAGNTLTARLEPARRKE
ncbi:MAG: hypothetical protein HFE64_01480 [Lachnospiraceae bacterium]|jgi:hypothetical protein|nr:hypothetical protein [Lachnospiraceae bacterium]